MTAYERERAEYDRRESAHTACVNAAQARHTGEIDAERERGDALRAQAEGELTDARQARLEAMAERVRAAQARNDQATVRALAAKRGRW